MKTYSVWVQEGSFGYFVGEWEDREGAEYAAERWNRNPVADGFPRNAKFTAQEN